MTLARHLRELLALTRGQKNLRVLAASGALATVASGALNPLLPGYLQSRGLDLQRIGLVFTVASLVPIVAQPALGALSDRASRKHLVVGLSLASALLLLAFPLLTGAVALGLVIALRLTLARAEEPVSSAMVADIAPPTQRATSFALLDSVTQLAYVASLLASSALVALLGVTGVFAAGSVLLATAALLLLRLKETPPARRDTPRVSWRETWRGVMTPWVSLRHKRGAAPLFAYQLFLSFALALYPLYVPLFALQLGAPQTMIGPLIAASWLVFALLQPAGGRLSDRTAGRKGVATLGLWGMVACSALLGLCGLLPRPHALWALAAAWVLLAVPDALFRPAAQALVVELAPEGERGQLFGALGSVGSLAGAVAPLAYGVVATRASLGAAFLVSSACFVLALVALLRLDEPAPVPLPNPEPQR